MSYLSAIRICLRQDLNSIVFGLQSATYNRNEHYNLVLHNVSIRRWTEASRSSLLLACFGIRYLFYSGEPTSRRVPSSPDYLCTSYLLFVYN